mmetsp:Transcript_51578/g.117304  ORF Transcript_51578/g.117304 Transcript_51578/m.117304 type:complete len:262 (-) Transcript_51578:81-866(-)
MSWSSYHPSVGSLAGHATASTKSIQAEPNSSCKSLSQSTTSIPRVLMFLKTKDSFHAKVPLSAGSAGPLITCCEPIDNENRAPGAALTRWVRTIVTSTSLKGMNKASWEPTCSCRVPGDPSSPTDSAASALTLASLTCSSSVASRGSTSATDPRHSWIAVSIAAWEPYLSYPTATSIREARHPNSSALSLSKPCRFWVSSCPVNFSVLRVVSNLLIILFVRSTKVEWRLRSFSASSQACSSSARRSCAAIRCFRSLAIRIS